MMNAGLPAALPDARTGPCDRTDVRAFQAGDPAAFERLLERYQRPLLRLCQRLLGRDDARDLFQEVFLLVFRRLEQLREPDAFRTWLYRIAIRKARRLRHRGPPAGGLEVARLKAPETADPLVRKEALQELWRALEELPERQREVVLLRHYENLSYAEIGAVLDIREEAARASHYQAVRKLRHRLGPGDPRR